MLASRVPAFSPRAAKPNATLQDVVDLPTPPLPEATAMTCLTPGMPAGFAARALGSCLGSCLGSWGMAVAPGSSRSERIAFLPVARAQIVFRRHHGRSLRRPVRVEPLVDDGLDAAVGAHLDDVDTPGIGALEHPVLLAEFGEHAVDRAFGAERLVAGDTMKGLFLLQHPQRRVPGLEIQPRLQGDDLFRTGRLAQPALHAQAFGEA